MKWEYLRVLITGRILHPNKVIVIGDDDRQVSWHKQSGESTHPSVVTRLLRELGNTGWELTGVADQEFSNMLFFKRPRM